MWLNPYRCLASTTWNILPVLFFSKTYGFRSDITVSGLFVFDLCLMLEGSEFIIKGACHNGRQGDRRETEDTMWVKVGTSEGNGVGILNV